MVFIVHNIIQTSCEVAVTVEASDSVEDTNPWTDSVSLSLLTFPTPVADLDPSHLFAMVDVVWMGSVERLEMPSLRAFDNSAAKRLEMSRSFLGALDASAANCLEMSGLATIDNSATCSEPIGQICHSCALSCDEFGNAAHLQDFRSKQLAAESAPTLVVYPKVADAVTGHNSDVAPTLVAGVDAGPGEMEGAYTINNSGTKLIQNCFAMDDWNDLLETEDQLGPLPSLWTMSRLETASTERILPHIGYGASLMTEILNDLEQSSNENIHRIVLEPLMRSCADESDVESIATSETLTTTDEDGDPVIFCGMGRISTYRSETSDSEHSEQKKSKSPSSSSKHTIPRHKAKKNRKNSSSKGRKIDVKSFKRESCEMPEGGWFRATTAALTSDSSPSSSESPSDSSSSDEEAELGSRKLRFSRTVKIKNPCTYDGRADLDLFDQWTYEVDTWRELNGISNRMAVKILVNFMSGKASRFFMKHVALRQKDWTLKSIYEALFNYCFPPDFKLQLREQLTRAKQGSNNVRDFQRDLETLAVRFPDVTEREIRQIFWTGIRRYLRLHLIEKGLNPERHSMDKLVKYASRHEAARETLKRERDNLNATHGTRHYDSSSVYATSGGTLGGATSNSLHDVDEYPGSEAESTNSEYDLQDGSLSDRSDDALDRDTHQKRVLLPQEEYARLRREGRCFQCQVKGHLSRNCPGKEEESPVEVLAAHFAQHNGDDDSSEDEETDDRPPQSGKVDTSSGDEGSTDAEENLYSPGNDSHDSDDDYYFGAMMIDLHSDRGHHLEGVRLWSGIATETRKGLMQRSKGGRFVKTNLEGRM